MRIERQVETRDANGDEAITWEPITGVAATSTVWAAIEPLSGREFVAAGTTQSQVVARLTIRYRAGLIPSMRMVHVVNGVDGDVYNAEEFLTDKDSGREYLTVPASRGVNDGQ